MGHNNATSIELDNAADVLDEINPKDVKQEEALNLASDILRNLAEDCEVTIDDDNLT